jgi:putative glycosyltransferase (TIGR04372 family)
MYSLLKIKIRNQVVKYLKKYLIFFFNHKENNYFKNKNLNFEYINFLKEPQKNILSPSQLYKAIQTCLEGPNPIEYYDLIDPYKHSIIQWKKKYNLDIFNTSFLPSQQIIGSLGNYYPLFFYLLINISEQTKNKPTIFISEKNNITNQYLLSFFKQYLNIVKSDSLQFYFNSVLDNLKIPLEILLPIDKHYYPWDFSVNILYQKNALNKNNYFRLNEKDINQGMKILNDYGIDSNKKFVVIHIRQDGYKNNYSMEHSVRNSDPNSYLKAIKFLISKDINVIRVGDKSMTKLPKLDGLFDYAHSNIKSDFMDVFFAAKCFFCIGTSSGFYPISMYFDRPVLLLNCVPLSPVLSLKEHSMFLPKKYIYADSKRKISIKKLFLFNYMMFSELKMLKKNNINVIDNSEDEILLSTMNMFQLNTGNLAKKEIIKNNSIFKNKVYEIFKRNNLKDFKIFANFPNFYTKDNLND